MSNIDLVTLHKIPQKCDGEKLMKQVDYLAALPVFTAGLDATNGIILILNSCLQAVFANKAFLNMVKIKVRSDIYGKRTGEIIKCIHATDGENGCGTGEACRYCDAVPIMLKALETNEESSGEFSNTNIINGYEQNVNLSIHMAPLRVQEEIFYMISFTDKSDSIRKKMLERIFFHDIINTAGALKGIMGLLKEDAPDMIKAELEFVEESFQYLVEEIQAQKYMIDAEDNQLRLEITKLETADILNIVSKLYEGHDVKINKTIIIDVHCINIGLYTDQRLLRRILGNMIKNALEASDEGGVVALGCCMDDDEKDWITFWVHNDNYMDERVQNLVFHRLFSTRGTGRGLGTYSMKLFGETFLKGKVGFFTDKDKGTRFYIRLPLK